MSPLSTLDFQVAFPCWPNERVRPLKIGFTSACFLWSEVEEHTWWAAPGMDVRDTEFYGQQPYYILGTISHYFISCSSVHYYLPGNKLKIRQVVQFVQSPTAHQSCLKNLDGISGQERQPEILICGFSRFIQQISVKPSLSPDLLYESRAERWSSPVESQTLKTHSVIVGHGGGGGGGEGRGGEVLETQIWTSKSDEHQKWSSLCNSWAHESGQARSLEEGISS